MQINLQGCNNEASKIDRSLQPRNQDLDEKVPNKRGCWSEYRTIEDPSYYPRPHYFVDFVNQEEPQPMERLEILSFIPKELDALCMEYLGAHCDLLLTNIGVGFLVGFLARLIVPGPDPAGLILTTIIGFCGAMIGSYIGPMIGFAPATPVGQLGLAVAGAIVIVLSIKLVARV